MNSIRNEKKRQPGTIGASSDEAYEVCCIICNGLLILSVIVLGMTYLSVSNPEGAVAVALMLGLPALCISLIYVALQIRKITLSKE